MKGLSLTFISTILILWSCSGFAQLANTPWPMFMGNEKHTGISSYTGPETPTLDWKFMAGSNIESSPTIGSDGTIYFGCVDSYLYAINPDGTQKWKYLTGYWITLSSPAINDDGTIYIGSYDGYLHAVNPDGTQKWKFDTNDNITGSPTIGSDGTIYLNAGDGYLYSINPDGSQK